MASRGSIMMTKNKLVSHKIFKKHEMKKKKKKEGSFLCD